MRRSTTPAGPPIGRPKSGAAGIRAGRAAVAICSLPRRCPTRRRRRPRPNSSNPPGAGTRNGEPLYAFPAKRIVHHLIPETPVRTSSLRGLGATLNVFAIELSMDELAERAGEDPVAYRLSVLADPRARAVVEQVARISGWQPGCLQARGRGRGIGFARYKNIAAYAAVVAEVEVDEQVRVTRVWCACRCRPRHQPGRRDQPARRRHHPGRQLGIEGRRAARQRRDQLARLGELSGAALHRGAGDRRSSWSSPADGTPPLGVGEASRRPDRRRDRQRRRPCARARGCATCR